MNKFIIFGLAAILMLFITGCVQDASTGDNSEVKLPVVTHNPEDNDGTDKPDYTDDEYDYYVTPTDEIKTGEVITVGEILQFDGEYIHIIAGDLVQVYQYDSNQAYEYYLGQTVSLIKGDENNVLEVYIKEDFDTHYTNMGHMLIGITGVITDVTDEEITVKSETDEITVSTYDTVALEVGTNVTIYCMSFVENEQPSLVMMFNEDTKLELTVNKITRSAEGVMLLSMTDADGGEYEVSASSCLLELNMSEIKIGDELTVYHDGIMESWPMQLVTTLISK